MASRTLTDLTLNMQKKEARLRTQATTAGLVYCVTCTARSSVEQEALYAQGRVEPCEVNRLRKVAGLDPIRDDEARRKVTWTLSSKHITGPGIRAKAEAFDVVIMNNRTPSWDVKVDTNHSHGPDYDELGKMAKACGLRWGGTFSSPDRPHFEDDGSIA